METQPQSQSRRQEKAQWPTDVSHYMLDLLTQNHRSGRNGDNGLRKDQWEGISKSINDRYQTAYDWSQCRTHYRIWKSRIRALCALKNDSGMGWNDKEMRFDSAPHVWADKTKKDVKFWREHSIQQIHLDVALWMGNEIATGSDTIHPTEIGNLSLDDHYEPLHDLEEMEVPGERVNEDADSVRSTTVASSSRKRGRPPADVTEGACKKKKGGVEKVASPLKAIASSIKDLVSKDARQDFFNQISEAIKSIPNIDRTTKWKAKNYFSINQVKGRLFLSADEDERLEILEMCKADIDQLQ